MPSWTNSRNSPKAALFSGAIFLLPAIGVCGQAIGSNLPPTSPTAVSQANSLPPPIVATPLTPQDAVPRSKAKIIYTAGLLHVEANNSSLNGILRDIAKMTGMKITGGVTDQRVFGSYGPADSSTVLATLLGGTDSNMLLKESSNSGPAELILTPRTGGPTPPNPAAAYDEAEETAPSPSQDQQSQAMAGQAAHSRELPGGAQPPNDAQGNPNNTAPAAYGQAPAINAAAGDSSNPSTSGDAGAGNNASATPTANAEKTPEQILQQLLQLRQAAQQQQSGGANPNSSTIPIQHP